jgi:hypothetical protein
MKGCQIPLEMRKNIGKDGAGWKRRFPGSSLARFSSPAAPGSFPPVFPLFPSGIFLFSKKQRRGDSDDRERIL